jgi:hypothetical protein
MEQVIQLQQQIQRLQQEINDITQVCNQLQQSEQANAMQLQQMTQKELLASQGLRRIQQVAGQLSQDINQISNITHQMVASPLQRTVQTTGVFPGAYTTYAGLSSQIPGTGVFSTQNQMGAFGQNQLGAFGQSQLGYGQSQIPNISMSPAVTQLPLYTQGYSANLFGTGSHMGTGSQAFSNTAQNQLGIGSQAFSNTAQNQLGIGNQAFSNTAQNQLGIGSQAFSNTAQNQLHGNLAGSMYSPWHTASMAMTSPMSTLSSLGTASTGYSPYQANQFGFR